ncbi:DUF2996 domain-containing protein [Leptolyngbya sp. NIES-2104]|uniref:DUF2996 domain-containing protein n=1 Tax=Leptolyngbya sp. NIES-2104 TaxID=1552121 RepID=UPI0006EC8138|nr:DUF2996 domain-containing protein [Leptolyngbya sp. NIES-2104]GAP94114.1 hypothetical protein NIES2104_06240 [Leptolyngbya sp. NIES-2104]
MSSEAITNLPQQETSEVGESQSEPVEPETDKAPQAARDESSDDAPNSPEEAPSIEEENISVARVAEDVVKENIVSTTVAESTSIPSANAPDPSAVSGDNPNASKIDESRIRTTEESIKGKPGSQAKPAKEKTNQPAQEKKSKAPGAETKLFADFMQQDYVPALQQILTKLELPDVEIAFQKQKMPLPGYTHVECSQVIGHWNRGQDQFTVYFFDDDVQGQRGFSLANAGTHPSTLEPFWIDERKVNLDVLVLGVVQRLHAEKWIGRN